MQVVTLDMETRSEVDLRSTGVHPYSAHPSTDIICIAVKKNDEPTKLWLGHSFRDFADRPLLSNGELNQMVADADVLVAHNAMFERVLWDNVMHARYGFSAIPLKKWRCTMAKTSSHALPRALGKACDVLGLQHKKDNRGRRVMLKMCKPRKPTKNNKAKWHEKQDDFTILFDYCIDDVEAECDLDRYLPDLEAYEAGVWRHDQVVNDRGVYVNIPVIQKLINWTEREQQRLCMELQTLTNGMVHTGTQVLQLKRWLKTKGFEVSSLDQAAVLALLKSPRMTDRVRRVLEIRQSLGKTSVKKLQSMVDRADADGRCRGTILYHGASTGRYSGRGIQPHNYPRDSYQPQDIEILSGIPEEDLDLVRLIYDCPVVAASRCLRGMIQAAPGHTLLTADFSGVEARGLAWLAREEAVLKAYADNLDPYKVAACDIYPGVSYDEVTKDQRFFGKTLTLACGYQGWTKAFRKMAESIGSDEVDKLSDEVIKEKIWAWRQARPRTTALWKNLEEAAKQATEYIGKAFSVNGITFYRDNEDFLYCRLPSGRRIAWYKPNITMVQRPYKEEKVPALCFYGENAVHQWGLQYTYGGKITENVIQALCRDLLVHGMINVEKAGIPVVLHVHDEIVAEVPEKEADLDRFVALLTEKPKWAQTFPLEAEGWTGKVYRK